MDHNIIRHQPSHIDFTLARHLEYEQEICLSPADQSAVAAKCPECGCTMMYRGIARLRKGALVHYFECVHSHREVHSISIAFGQ